MHELTEFGQEIFNDRYTLFPGETWEEACKRVATAVSIVERYDEVKKYRDEFYDLLIDNHFMPAGRIWCAAGRPRGNMLNCYVLPTDDSREAWGQAIKDTIIVTGMGGGIGINCSTIRPQGDPIKGTGGIAGGPLAFMEVVNALGEVIQASGGRRMALMLALEVNHPNVEDFIKAKLQEHKLNNANVSVIIPHNGPGAEFFKAVKRDKEYHLTWKDRIRKTIKAKDLWDTLVMNAITKAEPGILNFHLMNEMNNIGYAKKLVCTNPCLTGDGRLLTAEGYKTIEELWELGGCQEFDGSPSIEKHGQLMVFNDSGVVPATNVYKTSDDADIYRVTFDDGSHIDATENHKFIGVNEEGEQYRCELKDLEEGDSVPVAPEGGFGKFHDLEYARLAGWIIGDGSLSIRDGYCNAHVRIWGDDIEEVAPILKSDLQKFYDDNTNSTTQSNNWAEKEAKSQKGFDTSRLDLNSRTLGRVLAEDGVIPGSKHHVPKRIWQGDKETVAQFLRALFSADGSVQISNYNKSISIRNCQVNKSILDECQLLFRQFGIKSSVLKRREAGQKMMNDGKGGKKLYNKKAEYEIILSGIINVNLYMKHIGFFQSKKINKANEWLHNHKGSNNTKPTYIKKIKSIEFLNRQRTFCLTEPETHRIIINGVLGLQCGEIGLEPYGACNLGSLVLPKFVKDGKFDWGMLSKVIKPAIRFLDNVLDATNYPIPEIEANVKQVRRLGLGVTGLHDCLLLQGLDYDEKGIDFVEKLMEFIRDEVYKNSAELAGEKGVFPIYNHSKFMESGFAKDLPPYIKGLITQKGMRNCALLTIAPTGTTSIVCGTSSGIEPIFSLGFQRTIRKGKESHKRMVVHPLIQQLIDAGQDVSKIKTTYDVSVRTHLEMQKVCQKYVDNSIAKTINLPRSVLKDKEEQQQINELLLEYIPFLKGVTLYADGSRGEAPIQSVKIEDLIKANCPNGMCSL